MKQSFVDFPATISAVIFTDGCNLRCWYCHNSQLIKGNNNFSMTLDEIFDFLESRKGFLDGVVISGGEPTIHSDLPELIDKIKSMGFKVKLDTNGTNPEMLKKVLSKLDYVAMDIKNSLEHYSKTVGLVDIEKIKESINLIKTNAKDYEFRTTFSPDITLDDIENMSKMLVGVKKYVLQTYNAQTPDSPKQSLENYQKALNIIKKYIPNALNR